MRTSRSLSCITERQSGLGWFVSSRCHTWFSRQKYVSQPHCSPRNVLTCLTMNSDVSIS